MLLKAIGSNLMFWFLPFCVIALRQILFPYTEAAITLSSLKNPSPPLPLIILLSESDSKEDFLLFQVVEKGSSSASSRRAGSCSPGTGLPIPVLCYLDGGLFYCRPVWLV